MESKRTHDELKEILDRNTAWIENCDSKTSIILGSFGVIAGIFLATDYTPHRWTSCLSGWKCGSPTISP